MPALEKKPNRSDRLAAPIGRLNPMQCVLRHVLLLSRAVFTVYDRALEPVGVTGHQFNFMMTLHHVGPTTVGNIARILAMHGSSVPRAIGPMVSRGWISVEQAPDRRKRIVAVTAAGRAKLADGMPLWEDVQRDFLDRIGDEAWQESIPVLRSVGQAAVEIAEVRPPSTSSRWLSSKRPTRKVAATVEAADVESAGRPKRKIAGRA